jgi:hypothetical protein
VTVIDRLRKFGFSVNVRLATTGKDHRMNRKFLLGVLAGAALGISASGASTMWLRNDKEPLYLRLIDDNFDHILGPDYKPETEGPAGLKLLRDCKIMTFLTDAGGPDAASSSFISLEATPPANLNCIIGEARIHSMSIAVVRGIDTTPTDCLGGWPTRFLDREAGDFNLCVGGKNPNPIFIPTPPPKR